MVPKWLTHPHPSHPSWLAAEMSSSSLGKNQRIFSQLKSPKNDSNFCWFMSPVLCEPMGCSAQNNQFYSVLQSHSSRHDGSGARFQLCRGMFFFAPTPLCLELKLGLHWGESAARCSMRGCGSMRVLNSTSLAIKNTGCSCVVLWRCHRHAAMKSNIQSAVVASTDTMYVLDLY